MQGYKLAEAEAQILMPCLVEKAGHGQVRAPALHRSSCKVGGHGAFNGGQ